MRIFRNNGDSIQLNEMEPGIIYCLTWVEFPGIRGALLGVPGIYWGHTGTVTFEKPHTGVSRN